MKFVIYNQWNQLPASADLLFAQAEQESLFNSRNWLENLTFNALAEDQALMLACVIENDQMLAIVPMIQHAQGSVSSLSNHFTSQYSLIMAKVGHQDAVLKCLVDGFSRLPYQPVRFDPYDSSDDYLCRLFQMMVNSGFNGHSYFRFHNWSHEVNGQSFEEYMAERPANLRNTITRKQRKLEREHNVDIRLYQDSNIDQAINDYQFVYQRSWKANEFYFDFTPNLVRQFSQCGWCRLAVLYIDEQPAAAQIWFVAHGKANIFRLVYDENWKQYSPGSVLTKYLMRHVIDNDKVLMIDFLTGNERYKQDWMSVKKERLGIRFIKRTKHVSRYHRTLNKLKSTFTTKEQRQKYS